MARSSRSPVTMTFVSVGAQLVEELAGPAGHGPEVPGVHPDRRQPGPAAATARRIPSSIVVGVHQEGGVRAERATWASKAARSSPNDRMKACATVPAVGTP